MGLELVDVRTLAFVSCFGGLVLALTMIGMHLGGTRQRGLLFWALGGLFYGSGYLLGFVLLSFALQVPGWLATSLANNLITTGHVLVLLGIQAYLGRRVWYWALALPPLALAMVFVPALRLFPTPMIVDSVLMIAPCLVAAGLLLINPVRRMLLVHRATALIIGAMGLFLAGRVIFMMATQAVGGSFDQHALQALAFLVSTLYGFLLTMALVLTVFRRKELRLREVARRDPLTGLRNRLSLDDHARRELDFAQRYQAPLCLVAIDLDHFKRINDRHGHGGGDAVLKTMADLLTDELRSTDLVFRIGGEEFLVILPFSGLNDSALVAERIRDRVERHRFSGVVGERINVSASLGVAEVRMAEETWDEALLRADRALYDAKEGGRNRVMAANLDEWKRPVSLDLDSLLWSGSPHGLLRCVNG